MTDRGRAALVRILGGVEVERPPGQPTEPLADREAQVLGLLALRAPEPLTKDYLHGVIWHGAGRTKNVESIIGDIRKKCQFSKEEHLLTRGGSYLLDTMTVDVDCHLFTTRVQEALSSFTIRDPELTLDLLQEALNLWRGDPAPQLVDFAGHNTGLEELQQLHALAVEARIDTQMQLGQHRLCVPQLEKLVRLHSHQEHLWAQLMLALYRSGRQGDAVGRYQRARDVLADELGVEPGEELREMERRILNQDPALRQPDKASLRGSADGGHRMELEMYWGYRPAAHSDIRRTLLGCRRSLTVAGQGLSTVVDVVNDPEVVRALASNTSEAPEPLRLTFVFADTPLDMRERESGGRRLREKVESGLEAVEAFKGKLERQGSGAVVVIKTYKGGFLPRHFFLNCDEVLYVGSYLSHQQGSHSYLMKIHDAGGGLYALFQDELAYVIAHTKDYEGPQA